MANWRIENAVTLWPKKGVRGHVLGIFDERKLAHAQLYTNSPPRIRLWPPREPDIDVVDDYVAMLLAFCSKVEELDKP